MAGGFGNWKIPLAHRGNARIKPVRLAIVGHDRPCRDDTAGTDGDAREDCRRPAEPAAVPDSDRLVDGAARAAVTIANLVGLRQYRAPRTDPHVSA